MSFNKIQSLINLLKIYQLDFFILNNKDEYQCEYLQENSRRIKWLCEFSGSNATIIITTKNMHHFFTDGRYIEQAHQELDLDTFQVHDISEIKPFQWLQENCMSNNVVGYPSQLFSYNEIALYKSNKYILKALDKIIVDEIWHRNLVLDQKIITLPICYSGKNSLDKCREVISYFTEEEALLLTDVEFISWLLNIRNESCKYVPSVLSRAILYKNGQVDLFLPKNFTIVSNIESHINIKDNSELYDALNYLNSISIDHNSITMDLFNNLPTNIKLSVKEKNFFQIFLARKNKTEIEGAIEANIQDSVAVVKFLFWLYNSLQSSNVEITELSAAQKLREFRQKNHLFKGESFPTISAFAENGAIIHYQPTEKSNKIIKPNGLYLIDSGGQYLNGTTDTTRTIAIGIPTEQQIKHFTLVLKGHINIAQSKFPKSTTGSQLDALARIYLWQENLDYAHSTGHGVGSYLSVHEGPQAISKNNNIILEENMILSNEPGFYKNNEYGIRIENLMYITQINNKFLHFQPLTFIPIDKNLINIKMLDNLEKEWINQYHHKVYEKISPHIDNDTKLWLKYCCEQIN